MKLDQKQLSDYFTRYFKEYRKFLEQKYPTRRNEFTLYKDYPYEVNVYSDENGTRVFLDFGEKFKVNVSGVGKIPDRNEGKGKLLQSISNRYLLRILDKPELMAQLDVTSVFEHEKMMEEQALRDIKLMEKWFVEETDRQVKRWFEITEKTEEVRKTTLEKREKEVRTAILIAANQYASSEIYENIGHALFMASLDLCDILDASVFLAINGKYRAALALLRRWLETVCTGVYYDTKLRSANVSQKNSVYQEIQKWLAKPEYQRFKGRNGLISKLIDPDMEFKGSEILKARPNATQTSFKQYIEEQYSELSKFIHSGGTTSFETVIFVEFDDDLFTEWFNRFVEINAICGILTVLKFPEVMKFYSPYELNGFPFLDGDLVEQLSKLLAS